MATAKNPSEADLAKAGIIAKINERLNGERPLSADVLKALAETLEVIHRIDKARSANSSYC